MIQPGKHRGASEGLEGEPFMLRHIHRPSVQSLHRLAMNLRHDPLGTDEGPFKLHSQEVQ